MSDKLCIDLCSGLGGFSAAFRDAGWEVVTVDIESKFKPTIVADILKLRAKHIERSTERGSFKLYSKVVVVASPPCERFSLAAMGQGNTVFPGPGIGKALAIVGQCLELIAAIRPDAWLLENPKARLRWFLGKPGVTVHYKNYGGQTLKPTDFWGAIHLPLNSVEHTKRDWMQEPGYKELSPIGRQRYRHRRWALLKRNSAERAIVPYGLSQTILEAIEGERAEARREGERVG